MPDARAVAAFVSRFYVCHACGDAGLETRDTDPGAGTARFRLGAGRLLLSSCAACGIDETVRRRAAEELTRQVDRDQLAWVDPARLLAHWCPVPGCERLWHHLGGPLPFVSLGDHHSSTPLRRWHPCPWCTAEDLDGATAAQERTRGELTDLAAWESELGSPG